MPKDTKTLGNNKARAWESLGFVHKKRLGQRFDTTSRRHHTPYRQDRIREVSCKCNGSARHIYRYKHTFVWLPQSQSMKREWW